MQDFQLRQDTNNLNGDMTVSYGEKIDLNLVVAGESLDLNWLFGAEKDDFTEDNLVNREILEQLRWNIQIQSRQVEVGGLRLKRVQAVSRSDGQKILLDLQAGNVLAGKLNARIALDMSQNETLWQARFQVASIAMKELGTLIEIDTGISSQANLNGYLSMSGDSISEIKNSGKGEISVTGLPGRIELESFKEAARSIAKIAGDESLVLEWPSSMDFSEFSAIWKVNRGILDQELNMELENFRLNAIGFFDPWADSIGLEVTFKILEDNAWFERGFK